MPAIVLDYYNFQGIALEDCKRFISCFLMYYLCEKYYKPFTVQYYIANCVSAVPRLILLDLRKNWTYRHTLEWKSFYT